MRVTISAILIASASAAAGPGLEITKKEVSMVPETEDVFYTCTFLNNWSGTNHPNMYPSGGRPNGAHWSPVILASHSMDYTMFEVGGMSSPGVKLVAEVSFNIMIASCRFAHTLIRLDHPVPSCRSLVT